MIHFELTWQQAEAAAAVLGCATLALRASGRPRLTGPAAFTQETALVFGLFGLWQLAGSFTVFGPGGALARSRWIWHFERVIALPSETSVQRFFLPHAWIVQFFNLYYLGLHFPVLIACMIWLFVWHRDSYRRVRTTVVAFTGISLLIQLIPVAPPRMLPWTGLVDTGVLYHQSVYSNATGFDADQLSAMPSVHVGWAIIVALAVIGTARTRWRWLALGYPVMTTFAVVVTANHFWLDGIAAGVLVVLVLAGQHLARRYRSGRAEAADATTVSVPEAVPVERAPQWLSASVVLDDDAEALGEHGRERTKLAGADDGTTQRLRIDGDAELGPAQIGPVELCPAEVSPGELRTGEGALRQAGVSEVDVTQDAPVECDAAEPSAAEVDGVELAPAEYDAQQVSAEDLGAGERGPKHRHVLPAALGQARARQPDVSHPDVAERCALEPSLYQRNAPESAL